MLFPSLRKKIYHGILLEAPRDGDDSCRECGGACCSSFAAVEVNWDEYERLQRLGARRLQLSLYGPHRLEIDYGCESDSWTLLHLRSASGCLPAVLLYRYLKDPGWFGKFPKKQKRPAVTTVWQRAAYLPECPRTISISHPAG